MSPAAADLVRGGRPFCEIAPFCRATGAEWNDWRWQQRNCVRDLATLDRIVRLTPEERQGALATQESFRFSITPYWAALMDPEDPMCPVRMQAIPVAAEARRAPSAMRDPLGEDAYMPVPHLVHRYPDRVLLLCNNVCPVYCRCCTRKRLTGAPNRAIASGEIDRAVEYLRATPAVREVILSGGEPLLLADARIDDVLARLRRVPSIEVVRVHTRAPVVMPMRVTPALCDMLRRHHPLWLVTHFNHPKELTDGAISACARLVDAGIPVGNQTVLLRRVNSSARILKDLSHRLVRARVWPYYLHQSDLAEGVEHLRTPVAAGVAMMEKLVGWTSGIAVPRFVIDTPGGGKAPVAPQYVVSQGERATVVRSYEMRTFEYPDPGERDCAVPYEDKWFAASPASAARDARAPGPAGLVPLRSARGGAE